MEWIFLITATDRPGLMAMVSHVFRRNISAIRALYSSGNAGRVQITVVATADVRRAVRIRAQLSKLHDMERVEMYPSDLARPRVLAVFKVSSSITTRPQLLQLAAEFHARLLHIGQDWVEIEVTGNSDEISCLAEILERYGVQETAFSGPAIARTMRSAAMPQEDISHEMQQIVTESDERNSYGSDSL